MNVVMFALCMFSISTTICVGMCCIMARVIARLRDRIVELEQRTRWLLPVTDKEFKEKRDGHRHWRKEHNTAH